METRTMPIETITTTSAMGAAAAVLQWVGLPWESWIVLAVVMVVDFMTGVMAAYATGQPIASRRANVGLMSKVAMLLFVVSFSLLTKLLGADGLAVASWLVLAICIAEVYSTGSNIAAILTGKKWPELDAWALLGKKLKQLFLKMLGD